MSHKPSPPVGPSAPVFGLATARANAKRAKLKRAELAAVLARHRAGDTAAEQRLRRGFEHLVFELPECLLGSGWLVMAIAIERLRNNHKRDAARYVKNEIAYWRRSLSRYAVGRGDAPGDDPTIRVPKSTKSRRKKAGLPPHQDLKRTPNPDDSGEEGYPYEQQKMNDRQSFERLAHKHGWDADSETLFVARLLHDGLEVPDIVAKYALAEYRVETIKAQIGDDLIADRIPEAA